MTTLKVPMQVVDAETGNVIEERTADWQIMAPTDPEACQECAWRHAATDPHNKQQLHYQYTFYAKHDRWPTWKDAMAHCSPEVQEHWERGLRAGGNWDGPAEGKSE